MTLMLLPAAHVLADGWQFSRNGVGLDFRAAAPANSPKFAVTEAPSKEGISDPTGYFVRLGNYRAVELDSTGHHTNRGVGHFAKSLSLTLTIPKSVVEGLRSHGIVDPVLYFWNPQSGHWVSAASTQPQGPFSFRSFARHKQLFGGGMKMSVNINSWPADDPICGLGG
jgi:hypothetical protein